MNPLRILVTKALTKLIEIVHIPQRNKDITNSPSRLLTITEIKMHATIGIGELDKHEILQERLMRTPSYISIIYRFTFIHWHRRECICALQVSSTCNTCKHACVHLTSQILMQCYEWKAKKEESPSAMQIRKRRRV